MGEEPAPNEDERRHGNAIRYGRRILERSDTVEPAVDVLVRLTAGTTTYHFGRKESICGEVLANEATAMSLDDALDLGRRLCVKCGRLVVAWAGSAIAVAGKKSLVHPDR